jgi:hypothetical protein
MSNLCPGLQEVKSPKKPNQNKPGMLQKPLIEFLISSQSTRENSLSQGWGKRRCFISRDL